jgi:hypothetical protein
MTDDERQMTRTFIETVPSDGGWKATEPNGESDIWGRGKTRIDAVRSYLDALEECQAAPPAPEVAADD